MSSRLRRTLAAVGLAAASALGVAGLGPTATASAAPAPRLDTTGPDLLALGDRGNCHGVVYVGIDALGGGRANIVFTPGGFTGFGPEWDADPHCSVPVNIGWLDGRGFHYTSTSVRVGAGTGPQVVSIDATPGPVMYALGTPRLSKGVGGYALL